MCLQPDITIQFHDGVDIEYESDDNGDSGSDDSSNEIMGLVRSLYFNYWVLWLIICQNITTKCDPLKRSFLYQQNELIFVANVVSQSKIDSSLFCLFFLFRIDNKL